MNKQQRADRKATLKSLRELAKFLRDNPQVPLPYFSFTSYVSSLDQVREATHLTGKWDKTYADAYVYYRKSFGTDVTYSLTAKRECTARVVGKRVIPATESYEVDEVEWDCKPE